MQTNINSFFILHPLFYPHNYKWHRQYMFKFSYMYTASYEFSLEHWSATPPVTQQNRDTWRLKYFWLVHVNIEWMTHYYTPTCQDATGDPWDALDLTHIVGNEVLVTGSIEERWITEHAPQLGGDCPISCFNGLGTHIKALPHQCAVPQDTHTAEKKGTKRLSGHWWSGWWLCVCVCLFGSKHFVYCFSKDSKY